MSAKKLTMQSNLGTIEFNWNIKTEELVFKSTNEVWFTREEAHLLMLYLQEKLGYGKLQQHETGWKGAE